MKKDPTPVLNAVEDPAAMKQILDYITLIRMVVGPALERAGQQSADAFAMHQSYLITAGAMFSGYTVGHMLTLGALDEDADLEQIRHTVMAAMEAGIANGRAEAQKAMVAAGMGSRA
ncbi:hypothetical protein [Aurantiacibacter zhengii]|uniref:Uncharacterized protein n=1 Tax=Aurantiacibacter zhengii TaxID=2307003 RepID=A0A418NU97_9SPHN|nr:hypothetical protein [Aurantiacibacter zhengii]RIV87475.1 hypothetical protein D2V07_03755 [Aurantiacibacter zhengii]